MMELISFFFPLTYELKDILTFGFNALIAGLFIISALTYGCFIIKYFFLEKGSLKNIEEAAKALDGSEDVQQELLIPKFSSQLITHRFTANVINLARERGGVQLPVLINQIRSQIMNQFFFILAEAGTRVLIILGLLGTLVGLGLTVYEVTQVFTQLDLTTSEGAASLITNLSGPIQAMKTALSTSIMGLTLSFFLFFLNMKFRTVLELLLANTNAIIVAHVLPKLRTLDISTDLKDLIRAQESVAEKVMNGFSSIQQTTQEIGAMQARFSEIVNQIERMAMRTLDPDAIYQHLQGYFTELITPFRDMSRSTSVMAESLHSSNLKVEEVVERLAQETAEKLRLQLVQDRNELVTGLSNAVVNMTNRTEQNATKTADRVVEKLRAIRFGTSGYVFQFPSFQSFLLFIAAVGVATVTVWFMGG